MRNTNLSCKSEYITMRDGVRLGVGTTVLPQAFKTPISFLTCCCLLLMCSAVVQSQESVSQGYSPRASVDYPTHVYWGDTHLHSNLSVDAHGVGNQRLSPDEAYRFAKGEAVLAHNGQTAQLARPLDFLVIADHGVNMGVLSALAQADPLLLKNTIAQRWFQAQQQYPLNSKELINTTDSAQYKAMLLSIFGKGPNSYFFGAWGDDYIADPVFRQSVWDKVTGTADHYNQPGVFTAFSGYEWTSNYNGVHRVVIFKDPAEVVRQVLPFTTQDSEDPEQLWHYLANYEKTTHGEVLAIPHNGNVTNGTMFSLTDYQGKPLSADYAETRSRWEPLYEVTQTKGDGEAHPVLSPTDEFADYETWNSWKGWTMQGVETEGWIARKQSEYARSALKLGLQQKARLDVNPFKFGLIGSTDAHNSLSTADENNYWGKFTLSEPGPHRMLDFTSDKSFYSLVGWQYAASGYAGIWAEENTREALFAAMKRKEVYASTGPRIMVRFFGGWDYQSDDAFKPDLARIGYQKGVPMGGDLTSAPKDKSPSFLIRAVKDPDGANLDRVQVVKGWLDAKGQVHEKIYNVALSNDRKDLGAKTKPVGNTFDLSNASYTNTIGAPELAAVWADPDFDANELAFYYLRVLEIPTPRWTAHDAKYFKLKAIPEAVPMITQERAYSSPIWYTPPGM